MPGNAVFCELSDLLACEDQMTDWDDLTLSTGFLLSFLKGLYKDAC